MASRRKGRILAFQALHSWDMFYTQTGKAEIQEGLLNFSWAVTQNKKKLDSELAAFASLLVVGTVENIVVIDKMISAHLENWDMSRLNRVDLAILRLSVYALVYQSDIAPSIIIDEAIGISREFGTDDSYRFVNGVLDGIYKNLINEKKVNPL